MSKNKLRNVVSRDLKFKDVSEVNWYIVAQDQTKWKAMVSGCLTTQ